MNAEHPRATLPSPRTSQRRRWRLFLPLLGLAALAPPTAQALERNFAASAQLDYLAVPTATRARNQTFDGFTTELSLKMAVDVDDHVSANVKTCYGCHGFEMGMAFVDVRVAEPLTVRVGRFTPAFGDFPRRHDPANHRSNAKPLPYDMGRMLHIQEWAMSVLPAPYVDNGLQLMGTLPLNEALELDWALYAIGGLRGTSDALDVDYIQSRSGAFYYVDNNSRPSWGARLAAALYLGSRTSLHLGSSFLAGTYDPDNALDYWIAGADTALSLGTWALRAEYLLRRTRMSLGADPATRFRYGPGPSGTYDPYFLKDGFALELDGPLLPWLELVARLDGMRRRGNVPQGSPLRSESAILRSTLGLNLLYERALRVKISGEFWDFSDFADEVALHVGVVAAF